MKLHKNAKKKNLDYSNIAHYNFKRKPIRPTPLIWVVRLVVKLMLLKRKTKVTYLNGAKKKLKKPHLILANHCAFNDFYMFFKAFTSNKINYVVALDAFNDISDFIMRIIGAFPTRKFITDIAMLKNFKYCVNELKDSVLLYPESRYSLDGTLSWTPDSMGKFVKFLKVPVIAYNLSGSYIGDPQWNKYKQDYLPMEATASLIIKEEEIDSLSVEEINERIRNALAFNDWEYLKNCGKELKYKDRAHNLNALLYQCPHCKTEFKMQGEGSTLTCLECGVKYQMKTNGVLFNENGETIFDNVPDWFKWQRANVKEQVRSGKYLMESDCDVYTMPHAQGFVPQGKGTLYQDSEKTILKVTLYGEEKVIEYTGLTLESVHIEYAYKDVGDMFDFSIPNDSIWLHPTNRRDILTKVSIATEEIRDLASEKLKK